MHRNNSISDQTYIFQKKEMIKAKETLGETDRVSFAFDLMKGELIWVMN